MFRKVLIAFSLTFAVPAFCASKDGKVVVYRDTVRQDKECTYICFKDWQELLEIANSAENVGHASLAATVFFPPAGLLVISSYSANVMCASRAKKEWRRYLAAMYANFGIIVPWEYHHVKDSSDHNELMREHGY